MKKTIVMVLTIVMCLSIAVNTNAYNNPISVMSREAFVPKYSDQQLIEMAMNGILVNDSTTKVQIDRKMQNDSYVTTVNISRLLEKSIMSNGTVQEIYEAKSSSSMSVTDWLDTDIQLTNTINYSKAYNSDGHAIMKITSYASYMKCYESRYTIKGVDHFAKQQGEAYNSSLTMIGFKTESSTNNVVSGLREQSHSKNTGFSYYINSEATGLSGGTATVKYVYNGQTRSFSVTTQLFING